MQDLLINIAVNHEYLVYILVFVLTIIEGPIVSILAGILLRAEYFDLIPIYLTLISGDLVGDILWYELGFHSGKNFIPKYGKYFNITEETVTIMAAKFHRFKNSILIISKLTSGLGFAPVVLFTAGLARIPFRIYITLNTLGQIIWSGLLLIVGYYFGQFYSTLNNDFDRLSLIAVCILIAFAIIQFGKYLRTRLIK